MKEFKWPSSAPVSAAILVIDDDPLLRQFVELVLSQAGYNVSSAGTGALGLKALQHARWDLLLLDVEMPDMSGLDLLSLLRRYQKAPVKVMMMTARRDAETVTNSMITGADGYLLKPFDPDGLLLRVGAMLRAKSECEHAADPLAAAGATGAAARPTTH